MPAASVPSPAPLTDRVALVTGGAKGIGRATCLELVAARARVLCLDLDEKSGTALANENDPDRLRFLPTDVAHAAECETAVAAAIHAWGRIDILVNNAGIQLIDSYVPAHELPEPVWDRILDVNLKAAWLMARAALPAMLSGKRGGVIINVASVQGLQSMNHVAAYAASKGGLLSLTRQLALDYAAHGIRVVAVNPGTIDTPLVAEATSAAGLDRAQAEERAARAHPLGRMGRPEEVARVIRFLATDDASFLTGEFVNVDGGLMANGAWA